MAQIVEAIYEDGVLRLLKPLKGIAEHGRVRVTVEAEESISHPLVDCVGILPDEDAQEMLSIIDSEFEKVDLRDWE